jgi:hypothetical protein
VRIICDMFGYQTKNQNRKYKSKPIGPRKKKERDA